MVRSVFSATLVLVASAILAPVAWGGIMTPEGLKKDDLFRVVFVTRGTIQATSGLFTTYDGHVTTAATAAGLDTYYGEAVTWQAIVSTNDGTVAKTRLPSNSAPLYIMDEAKNWSKVSDGNCWTGSLLHAINFDESGKTLTGDTRVWTGTTSAGNPSSFVLGSPVNQGISLATFGESNSMGSTWIIAGGDNSDPQTFPLHLYAVSSVIQAVPEPGCLTLWACGLAAFGGVFFVRRRAAANRVAD